MLILHHSRNLNSIVFGEVKASPEHYDPDFKDAYLWLENQQTKKLLESMEFTNVEVRRLVVS